MRAIVEDAIVVSVDTRPWKKEGRSGTIRTAYIVVPGGGSPEGVTVWEPQDGEPDLWPEISDLAGTGQPVGLEVDFGARSFRGEGQLRISLRGIRTDATLAAVG